MPPYPGEANELVRGFESSLQENTLLFTETLFATVANARLRSPINVEPMIRPKLLDSNARSALAIDLGDAMNIDELVNQLHIFNSDNGGIFDQFAECWELIARDVEPGETKFILFETGSSVTFRVNKKGSSGKTSSIDIPNGGRLRVIH